MSETRNILIAMGAAVGIAGLVTLFVAGLLALISIVDARRRIRNADEYPISGDGAWPRQTGTYETGVEFRHPDPADQVPDDKDNPTTDPRWPGKVKRRAF